MVICESLFAFQIVLDVREYDEKTAKFIFLICIAAIFSVGFAYADWGSPDPQDGQVGHVSPVD